MQSCNFLLRRQTEGFRW